MIPRSGLEWLECADRHGWGPPLWNGTASAVHGLNRGKSGITVGFGDPEQVTRLKRLILGRANTVSITG